MARLAVRLARTAARPRADEPADGGGAPRQGEGPAARADAGSATARHVGNARARRRRQLRKHLGVRSRVTVLFGLGALVLSVAMGGISYLSARHFLVGEQESTAVHSAGVNAQSVRSQLVSDRIGGRRTLPQTAIDSVGAPPPGSVVLYYGGHRYATTIAADTVIPAQLRALVDAGQPATQNLVHGGQPYIAVGIPIPSLRAQYFESFSLADVNHVLRVLLLVLLSAALVTTVLGIALGRLASGRSLRPLSSVSRAAMAIASGKLATRLPDAEGDPDLAGLTTSFNRMVDQLEERIEREARFTSDVSHELRSPLTTLAASLDVLESHAAHLEPAGQRALVLLAADLRRFERMVGDLLEISRSDAGSADVAFEDVSAAELVRRSVEAGLRSLPPDLRRPAVETGAIEGTYLSVDKRRFERAMANLLENAAFYGGGATVVTAAPGPPLPDGRPTIQVAVEDRGPGVAASERTRVFERFYRGQAAGRRGAGTGTGLGLSLVAQHVRLNGGRVWVEQGPEGLGARFVVELPVADEPPVGDRPEGSG
ncbi:MAG: HAMP domain-containing sensor histidine kinase [Acidimicrobiales bacterium]